MLKNNMIIETTLPVISSNFEDIKEELKIQLKQFDLIVDENSIKTAKKMATQINKLSGEIDTLRKSKVSDLSAPIKEFETEAKSLSSLCQESRAKLLSQVKVFEDKEIVRAKTILDAELVSVYLKYGVKDEFRTVKVHDLAIISNLTKSGLAKKAKNAIDERVLTTKQFQEKIDTRLMTLEAICFKGGLQAPLTRENINHFLMIESDDEYLKKLVSLIQNEISRIEAMQQRKQQQTQKPQINISKPVQEPKANSVDNKYANFKNNVFAPKSRKKTFTVTAVFEIEVDASLENKLHDGLANKFAKAGFKTIPTIYVEEVRQAS